MNKFKNTTKVMEDLDVTDKLSGKGSVSKMRVLDNVKSCKVSG